MTTRRRLAQDSDGAGAPVVAPVYRYLRGYALDPGFSTRLDTAGVNEVLYRVPFEPLRPGPVGEYVEVMDVDPATGTWYEPVDLGDERIASQSGLPPSEGNPQFHQQLVYAAAMKTIQHFERALGRRIVWRPHVEGRRTLYVQRLRLYPHAIREANAYYDPDKTALLFGYFSAAEQTVGTNFPGGLVFTCLSPDIVAHETTHAILDSLHPRYMEETNPDVAAFHEGFADIVALLQRFTFTPLVEHQLASSRGQLDGDTAFGQLATQFGEALMGQRGALREMIGHTTDGRWTPVTPSPSDYSDAVEPHDRGAVLVATVFDAFLRLYRHRTQDLFRIATGGTGVLPAGSISPDLVRRLAAEAAEIAQHLLHVCIRALDYMPPVDPSFGSYLRALVTADLDIAPEDETGYRLALIEAFRARGIFPRQVFTLSVESLRWNRPVFTPRQQSALMRVVTHLEGPITQLMQAMDRRTIFEVSRSAQRALHRLLVQEGRLLSGAAREDLLNQLGLTGQPVSALFGREGRGLRFLRAGRPDDDYVPEIECHTIRPAFRAGREGRQIEQVIVTLTQQVTVDIGTDGVRRPMVFRGGCSLVLRPKTVRLTAEARDEGSAGTTRDADVVEYLVTKNIRSWERFCRQRAYLTGDGVPGAASSSLYADGVPSAHLNFHLLHHQP